MEAGYVISSLPKPLDIDNGRVQAAPVFAYRGLKKRKRHELAVGVDGETINIYNVQTQVLLTTYHIPPQAYLCCRPCSIYSRRVGESPAQRLTFVVLKDGKHTAKRRLLRFGEVLNGDSTFTKETRTELNLPDGDIVGLEALPSSVDVGSSFQVLISYSNGKVVCVSEDANQVAWTHQAVGKEATQCHYTDLVELDAARKGMLSSREDIVAAVAFDNADTAPLFCQLLTTANALSLNIFNIRNVSANTLGLSRSGMDLLGTVDLPQSKQLPVDAASQWNLHAASGQLCRLCNGTLYVYDLSHVVPRTLFTFGSESAPIDSFTRISSTSILLISENVAKIFETKYGSLQASRALNNAESLDSAGKKRKRDNVAESQVGMQLSPYFSDLNLATAVHGTNLVGLPVSLKNRGAKQSKTTGTLLIDVMGKGSRAEDMKNNLKTHTNEKRVRKWEQWCEEVDQLVEQQKTAKLEELVAKDVKPRSYQNELWDLPEQSTDMDNEKRRKALYLLGKIFAVGKSRTEESAPSGTLTIRLLSRNIIRWLAYSSMLSSTYLRQTLQTTVYPGELMYTIGEADSTLELLHEVLAMPTYLDLEEVIQALKMLIHSLDTPSVGQSPLAITAGPHAGDDVAMSNGDADSSLEMESHAAERELNRAISALHTGLELRSDSLRLVLARLHAFPRAAIKRTMQAMMLHKEVIFFIHILRIELAEGGWTSRYVDAGFDEFAEKNMYEAGDRDMEAPSDQAIRTIGDLLVCALDSISATGWLVGLAGSREAVEEIVDALRAEVSASLEGCYEASSLLGYLAEFERYGNQLEASQPRAEKRRRDDILETKPEDTTLPLGCRVEAPVLTNTKGGPLSKVELARERNRRVGEYSIDRIRI